MLDFTQKTAFNIQKQLLDLTPNDFDKRQGSIMQTTYGPVSFGFQELYNYLNMLQQNFFVRTSSGDFTDEIASYAGVVRRQATNTLAIFEFNIAVPIGSRFQTINGNKSVFFTILEQYYPTGNPAIDGFISNPSYFYFTGLCETTGTIGNVYFGPVIPVAPITNLIRALLVYILVEGAETETDASLIARYIYAIQNRPFGGNFASYKDAILGYQIRQGNAIIGGVGGVQIYPVWLTNLATNIDYLDRVLCSIISTDYNVPSTDLVNRLQNYICPLYVDSDNPTRDGYGVAPIGAEVLIVSPVEKSINISFDITYSQPPPSNINTLITTALQGYFLELRQSWGKESYTFDSTGRLLKELEYAIFVEPTWVNFNILNFQDSTSGINLRNYIRSITNIQIAGADPSTGSYRFVATPDLQELPKLGTLTINVL